MILRKDCFTLPEGVIYLDGNSLGPLPRRVANRVAQTVEREWGRQLIRGWNDAGWMAAPETVGNRVGRLIGAAPGSVTMGDTLSIKVFQAVAAGLALRPGRRLILSDRGNFPTDLYMAEGLARLTERHELHLVDPEDLPDAITDDVAVVLMTHVDYRTGRMHRMDSVTRAAQAAGAVMVWDLAHSAGAVPVEISQSGAEFAVGCTYKYLNGGPGAPAFIYVRPDLADGIEPALAGWLGHDAPFAFELGYRPAAGVGRMRVGTPPVLQMAALDAALDVWDDVAMEDVRRASITLSETFITAVEARCPGLALASPRDPAARGSQVSFAHPNGFAVMQALISRGVIGDFRAPDLMRFGFTPLYVSPEDVVAAAEILADILATGAWDRPEHHRRGAVT
ncbi:MAG: kynureninase [Pseudomonadota bacterium]